MLKAILSTAIIVVVSANAGFAAETATTHDMTADHKTPVAQTDMGSINQPFPVILQNEVIASGLCRLHLDNGTKLEVSCSNTKEGLI